MIPLFNEHSKKILKHIISFVTHPIVDTEKYIFETKWTFRFVFIIKYLLTRPESF